MPDELRRDADSCMPACEIAALLAKIQELWWAGGETYDGSARAGRLTSTFVRCIVVRHLGYRRYLNQRLVARDYIADSNSHSAHDT